jgi:hypothetical protein
LKSTPWCPPSTLQDSARARGVRWHLLRERAVGGRVDDGRVVRDPLGLHADGVGEAEPELHL